MIFKTKLQLRSIVLALLSMTGVQAHALGLGDIRVYSRLGDPLFAEVNLHLSAGERVDARCFSLKRSGDDDLPHVAQATFVVRRGGEATYLVIRSGNYLRDPAVRLGVAAACGYETSRDYTLLLAPATAPVERERGEWSGETGNLPRPSRRVERPRPESAATPETVVAPSALQVQKDVPARAITRKIREKASPVMARDRLLIMSSGEAGEPVLRLSAELANWRGDESAKESQRELLRLEYRMLQAIHAQATAQLEISEKLRQMESLLGELQQRTDDVGKRIESAPAAPSLPATAVTVVATPSPAPAAEAQATPVPTVPASVPTPPVKVIQGETPSWKSWVFYGVVALIVLLVAAWFFRRYRASQERYERDPSRLVPEPYIDPRHVEEFDDFDEVKPAPRVSAFSSQLPDDEPAGVLRPAGRQAQPAGNLSVAPEVPDGPPTLSQASVAAATVDEHFEVNPVMELADIMLSFGRVKGAAQALQEFIDNNPEEALQPWIRLLDVYRMAGMRNEFERVAAELNQHFNVEIQNWDEPGKASKNSAPVREGERVEPLPIQWPKGMRKAKSIEELSHIVGQLTQLWPTAECGDYLDQLLRSNRGGLRTGFSLAVVEEIMFLLDLREAVAKLDGEG